MRAWRGARQLRGAVGAAIVALPHRDERLPGHAARPAAPGPADGSRARPSHGRLVAGGHAAGEHLGRSRSLTSRVLPDDGDPAELAVSRETIRLAFITALQHLAGPPARRPDPARGSALAGQRGRRTARHQRRVGEQRAAAGARHARPHASVEAPSKPAVDAEQQALLARYMRRVRALRHHRRWSRCCTTTRSCRCRRSRSGCADPTRSRAGCSAPASAARGRGSSRPRRTVAARSARTVRTPGWLRAVGPARHRDLRRPDRRRPQLPELPERRPVHVVRPPGASAELAISREDAEADEVEQFGQLAASVAQHYAVTSAPGGEMQPGQLIDGGEIRAPRSAERPSGHLAAVAHEHDARAAIPSHHTGRTTQAGETRRSRRVSFAGRAAAAPDSTRSWPPGRCGGPARSGARSGRLPP